MTPSNQDRSVPRQVPSHGLRREPPSSAFSRCLTTRQGFAHVAGRSVAPLEGLSAMGSDPARFQAKPPASLPGSQAGCPVTTSVAVDLRSMTRESCRKHQVAAGKEAGGGPRRRFWLQGEPGSMPVFAGGVCDGQRLDGDLNRAARVLGPVNLSCGGGPRGRVLAWRSTTSPGSWPAPGASRSAFRAR